jgi:hypothetical protein
VFRIQNSLSVAQPGGSSSGAPRALGSPNIFSCQRQKSRTRATICTWVRHRDSLSLRLFAPRLRATRAGASYRL